MTSSDSLPPALVLDKLPFDPSARRVEIDEFIIDNVMANLFLLALHDMQDVSKFKKYDDKDEDWFSYYNLAAIHGFPYENWRGVKNTSSTVPGDYEGYYCTHGSTVFPTWHRLYIHMFEQALYRKMASIAETFKEDRREEQRSALKRFRFPYWDPCMPRKNLTKPVDFEDRNVNGKPKKDSLYKMFDMPDILKVEEVYVKHPDGSEGKIRNPLLGFIFPSDEQYEKTGRKRIDWANKSGNSNPIEEIESYGYDKVTRTPGFTGKPNEDIFTFAVRNQFSSLSQSIFKLLCPKKDADSKRSVQRWTEFANHWFDKANQERWPNSVSIESWHDDIHDLCGSGLSSGHMAVVPVAAFDPIFWLHHNNIDRIFALWQALNHYEGTVDSFVADKPSEAENLCATSDLTPFVKEQNGSTTKFFNSKDVEDWSNLGYAVPGSKPVTKKGRDEIEKYIMNTYNWMSEKEPIPGEHFDYPKDVSKTYALSGKDIHAEAPVEFIALIDDELVKQSFSPTGEELRKPLHVHAVQEDNKDMQTFPLGSFVNREDMIMRTWQILLKVKKYAFNSSFTVNFFIGKNRVPSTSEALFSASSNVGFCSVFAFRPDAGCANCDLKRNILYSTVVPITSKLRDCLKTNTTHEWKWPPMELRRLESLSDKDVVPFLKQELEWRITKTNGEILTDAEIENSGLELMVASEDYTYPDKEYPMGFYSATKYHPDVTVDKVGGIAA